MKHENVLDYINWLSIFFFLLRGRRKSEGGKGGLSKIAAVITVPGLVYSHSTKKWLNDSCQKEGGKKLWVA